jgi:hypothetical protein
MSLAKITLAKSMRSKPGLWNRVIASTVKGVATGDATKSQEGTAEQPVAVDRLGRVLTARGYEATGGRHRRRDGNLVEADQSERDPFHWAAHHSLVAA